MTFSVQLNCQMTLLYDWESVFYVSFAKLVVLSQLYHYCIIGKVYLDS